MNTGQSFVMVAWYASLSALLLLLTPGQKCLVVRILFSMVSSGCLSSCANTTVNQYGAGLVSCMQTDLLVVGSSSPFYTTCGCWRLCSDFSLPRYETALTAAHLHVIGITGFPSLCCCNRLLLSIGMAGFLSLCWCNVGSLYLS